MRLLRTQTLPSQPTPNGNVVTSLATPSLGAKDVSIIGQRQLPGGFNPTHSHDRDEVMVQLAGSVTVSSDAASASAEPVGPKPAEPKTGASEEVVLEAGDTLIIPAGVRHRIVNTGAVEARWLVVAPAGVKFFGAEGEEMRPAWAR